MAQISSIAPPPDPNPLIQSGAVKSAPTAIATQKTTPATSPATGIPADEALSSPLQVQLTRFSSVLSGLQKNATATRAQYVQAHNKVKSGTYKVDPTDVSRSIVTDMLLKQ